MTKVELEFMEKPPKKKAEGLGDTLENIFRVVGITRFVEKITKKDCGCKNRKEKLNEIVPYNK